MGPCPASLRASFRISDASIVLELCESAGASVHQVSDLVAAGLCEEETIIGFSFSEAVL